MSEIQVPVYTLPMASTASHTGVRIEDTGGSFVLRLDYDRDGTIFNSGLRFMLVRAYRHRAESHCTVWHIEEAYDVLVEVRNSDWIHELVEAMPTDQNNQWEIHHYMIYIDSYGSYEIAAKSWEALPETEGALR